MLSKANAEKGERGQRCVAAMLVQAFDRYASAVNRLPIIGVVLYFLITKPRHSA